MNPEINLKKLIRKAGFVTHPDGKVDWSCNYDVELKQLVQLLVNHMVLTCEKSAEDNEKTYQYFLKEKDPVSAVISRGASLQAEKLAGYMKMMFP